MGVTELFMKALANKWVKLVDKVGYLGITVYSIFQQETDFLAMHFEK